MCAKTRLQEKCQKQCQFGLQYLPPDTTQQNDENEKFLSSNENYKADDENDGLK